METLLGILASLFAGVNIFQFIFFRSQKKKAGAEASQEGAKADGLNLENIKALMGFQGQELVSTTQKNKSLREDNDEKDSLIRKYDYEISDLRRIVSGLQKMRNEDIARRAHAEIHICLSLPCKDRVPFLGTYIHKTVEKIEDNETKTA